MICRNARSDGSEGGADRALLRPLCDWGSHGGARQATSRDATWRLGSEALRGRSGVGAQRPGLERPCPRLLTRGAPLPVVVDATVVRELLRVIEDVDVRRADRAERARDYPG